MRPTDPIAARLLGVVLRLESAPWPSSMRAYGAALLALSARCDRAPAKAEVYRWFSEAARGALVSRVPARYDCLRDAFHDMVAAIPSILLRFRASLDPSRRPNLRSMLVFMIHWRANTAYKARALYASRRAALLYDPRCAADRPDATTELREVLALLDGADPRHRALALVALGHNIADAARLTGVSRQAIYRIRDQLRDIIDG